MHEAGDGLEDEIVAGAVTVRAGLAEAGDRGIDEARVGGTEGLRADAESLGDAGTEIFNDYIGLCGDALGEFAVRSEFQIENGAFLIAVQPQEVGAYAVEEGRTPAPGFVAAWLFDLDDAGAEIGQEHGAHGARDGAGEIEDLDTLERRRHEGEAPASSSSSASTAAGTRMPQ